MLLPLLLLKKLLKSLKLKLQLKTPAAEENNEETQTL
jgi:hypothetical protein